MQLYRAKVSLGGSPHNQVMKEGLSAAEVIILDRIHNGVEGGNGAAITEVAKWDPPKTLPADELEALKKRSKKTERARLLGIYGVNFVKVFPNEFQALPEELDDGMLSGVAPVPDDEEEAAAVATEKDIRKILSVPKKGAADAGVLA